MKQGSGTRAAWRACACLALGGAQLVAAAQEWVPVEEDELDSMRGGFTIDGGLHVSLGVERLVAINGEVVSRTSIQLPDVGRMTEEQARETSAALSAVKLIQNGSDNMGQAGFSNDALGGTVIQNSLNDQHIESRTVINASVNSLALLTATNFQGNVSDAIARAAGPR